MIRMMIFCVALVACTVPPPQSYDGTATAATPQEKYVEPEPERKEPEKKHVPKRAQKPAATLPPCPPADEDVPGTEKIIRKLELLDCLLERK